MAVAYLGLGSNLGDRLANLQRALALLSRLGRVEAVSSLYETVPVGGPPGQAPYYNAVCCLATELPPRELLRALKEIEGELGRRPGPRWGPRPLDLDILLYDDRVVQEAGLEVPHPRLGERAFALVPLAELAPGVRHPVTGETVEGMLEGVVREGVALVAGPGWERP